MLSRGLALSGAVSLATLTPVVIIKMFIFPEYGDALQIALVFPLALVALLTWILFLALLRHPVVFEDVVPKRLKNIFAFLMRNT